jgi:guanylate kinase
MKTKNPPIKNIIIISGPSGSGQDSVIEGLQKILPIERVITTTTRKKRKDERQGKPYYFISQKEFEEKIKAKQFIEWAKEYNDNYYGVTLEEIERVGKSDKIGIWKIEYQGVITAKKIFPEIKAILIYSPLKNLEQRIRRRNPEYSNEFIKERLKYTKNFLKHKHIYDFKIINAERELPKTIKKAAEIITKKITPLR